MIIGNFTSAVTASPPPLLKTHLNVSLINICIVRTPCNII